MLKGEISMVFADKKNPQKTLPANYSLPHPTKTYFEINTPRNSEMDKSTKWLLVCQTMTASLVSYGYTSTLKSTLNYVWHKTQHLRYVRAYVWVVPWKTNWSDLLNLMINKFIKLTRYTNISQLTVFHFHKWLLAWESSLEIVDKPRN